jgi:hypothetical protein
VSAPPCSVFHGYKKFQKNKQNQKIQKTEESENENERMGGWYM